MSSGVPATTRVLAEDVRRAGGALIDAPVSGGVARAITGDLAIMVGARLSRKLAAAIARVEPPDQLGTQGPGGRHVDPIAGAPTAWRGIDIGDCTIGRLVLQRSSSQPPLLLAFDGGRPGCYVQASVATSEAEPQPVFLGDCGKCFC